MEFEMPQFECVAYAFDTGGKQIPKLPYTTAQLLGFAWMKQMYRRVKGLRKSLIIGLDGDHRSWKSVIACELGYILDPTFGENFEKRVVHGSRELLDAILALDKGKIFGGCIVVDEAGKAANKQKYYDEISQTINENVQIIGYLKTILIFVSPRRNFILASLRQMTHKHFYAERESNDFSMLRCYDIKYNPYKEESYKRKPRINLFGQKIKLGRVKFKNAPSWLIEKYEALETTRKPDMLQKMHDKIEESDIASKKKDIDELIKQVAANPGPYMSKRSSELNIILDETKIEMKIGVKSSQAKKIKSAAEEILEEINKPKRLEKMKLLREEDEKRKKEKEEKKAAA